MAHQDGQYKAPDKQVASKTEPSLLRRETPTSGSLRPERTGNWPGKKAGSAITGTEPSLLRRETPTSGSLRPERTGNWPGKKARSAITEILRRQTYRVTKYCPSLDTLHSKLGSGIPP